MSGGLYCPPLDGLVLPAASPAENAGLDEAPLDTSADEGDECEGEYAGLVGEYAGLVGLYAGDVGLYAGLVGE